MAQKQATTFAIQPHGRGQRLQPRLVFIRRVLESVVVAEARKIIVARVGVATLAIVEPAGQRIVVIPLYASNPLREQRRVDAVGIRPKSPKVAETINGFRAAPPSVFNRRVEREIVAV